eukprot:m.326336 g.326336  ORF g.326336 m.326336 type:complete len:327 (-) comp16557_c1_seq10:3460-4440(-)
MGGKGSKYDAVVEQMASQQGKTFVVTGTTTGTGNVYATTLLKKGAKVVCLNRESERSKAALETLKGIEGGEAHGVVCDLMDFASVKQAAAEVSKLCPEGVDVLCNNAGVMALQDKATKDGFDVQMQTNHLSHFLLVKLLMPDLEKAAEAKGEARIVNHSSIARLRGKVLEKKYFGPGGDLGGDDGGVTGPRMVRYGQTKSANIVFTNCLYDRLTAKNSKVKVYTAHPGVSKTSLQGNTIKSGTGGFLLNTFVALTAQSQEDGTLGILMASCKPDCPNGAFMGPGGGPKSYKGLPVEIPKEAEFDTKENKELLWTASCEAIGEQWDL